MCCVQPTNMPQMIDNISRMSNGSNISDNNRLPWLTQNLTNRYTSKAEKCTELKVDKKASISHDMKNDGQATQAHKHNAIKRTDPIYCPSNCTAFTMTFRFLWTTRNTYTQTKLHISPNCQVFVNSVSVCVLEILASSFPCMRFKWWMHRMGHTLHILCERRSIGIGIWCIREELIQHGNSTATTIA